MRLSSSVSSAEAEPLFFPFSLLPPFAGALKLLCGAEGVGQKGAAKRRKKGVLLKFN